MLALPFLAMHRGKPLGTEVLRVCRWDHADSKKSILPLVYCENDCGQSAWHHQQPPAPRPLYGLDHLVVLTSPG